jgi:hypothetical protein
MNFTAYGPSVNPVRYTQLLREACAAVKSARPKMPVVSGVLVGTARSGMEPAGEGDKPFLAGMYAAGAGSAMDAIGVHPYPVVENANELPIAWNPAAMEQSLDRLRAARSAAGTSHPIWITEVGESTTTQSGFPPPVTPIQQANDLVTMVTAAESDLDVHMMLIHGLQDQARGYPAPYNAGFAGFGLYLELGTEARRVRVEPTAARITRLLIHRDPTSP